MRDYAKVSPSFWTGETGRELRRRGIEGLIVGAYLMTSPGSNMLGLYYQPLLYMAHETGLGIEGVSKGLQDCIEAGFCHYDKATEMVWVVEMASYQIADELKTTDLRCKGIQKDYDSLPKNPFLGAWFDRYAAAFHLTRRRSIEGEKPEVAQAPSKPPRSQEQEQEQEQDEEHADSRDLAGPIPARPSTPEPPPAFDGLNAEGLNGKAVVQLAAAWELPTDWGNDAVALGFTPKEALYQAERFRQFFVAKGTRRNVKGWRLSWGNWLGKAAERQR